MSGTENRPIVSSHRHRNGNVWDDDHVTSDTWCTVCCTLPVTCGCWLHAVPLFAAIAIAARATVAARSAFTGPFSACCLLPLTMARVQGQSPRACPWRDMMRYAGITTYMSNGWVHICIGVQLGYRQDTKECSGRYTMMEWI